MDDRTSKPYTTYDGRMYRFRWRVGLPRYHVEALISGEWTQIGTVTKTRDSSGSATTWKADTMSRTLGRWYGSREMAIHDILRDTADTD